MWKQKKTQVSQLRRENIKSQNETPCKKGTIKLLETNSTFSFRYYVINSFSELLIKIYRILMTQVATKNDEVEVKSFLKLYLTSF